MNDERLYFNGKELILPIGQPIAKTFQVNDIGNITDRQTNFTRTINLPKNPTNIKILDFLDVIGNNSNIPYQQNRIDYYVGNECLIYNGWGKISEAGDTYKLNIYDGIIGFYKTVQNKFVTDADISLLNHNKTITNVVNSWTSNTPYQYIIADYNGKKTYTPTGTTQEIINIDYLIPSANVKFIWDRIFDKFGFTYEGNIFNSEAFKNLWISYPKENSTLVPNKLLINQQTFIPFQYTTTYYSGYAQLSNVINFAWLFQIPFSTPYAKVLPAGTTTTTFGDIIPNVPYINILQDGTYSIDLSGLSYTSIVNYKFKRNGVQYAFGQLEPNTTNTGLTKIFNCLAGDMLSFILVDPIATFSFSETFSRVDGYAVNFEDAFINFKITDFINEILQRFSLTMFPDKYENKLSFLTTAELLQSNNAINWSDKKPNLINTTYSLNGYSQNNRFKYKYNETDALYNDGLIVIDNINLSDEKTILSSLIYTPEKKQESMFDFQSNVYKFWNKEVKENNVIKYKALENRFYLMRSESHTFNTPLKIGSELVNTQQTITSCKKESYSRLKFQEIITDYYEPIGSILNKSKIFHVDLYLTTKDVNEFDFKKLVYIDQFGSYFLVNKISNFIPNKITRCELIEVDNNVTLSTYIPYIPYIPTFSATSLTINSVVVSGCQVTLNYSTDASIGTPINIVAQPNTFGVPVYTQPDPLYLYSSIIINSGTTNTISFSVDAGAYYNVQLSISAGYIATPINSNEFSFANVTSCIVSSPSQLTITNVTLVSAGTWSNSYNINFLTDTVLPRTVYYADYRTPSLFDPSNPYGGSFGGWSDYTSVSTSINSITADISTMFGTPLKVRIKIGNTVSNEYTI
jgi:hypothetical protein